MDIPKDNILSGGGWLRGALSPEARNGALLGTVARIKSVSERKVAVMPIGIGITER